MSIVRRVLGLGLAVGLGLLAAGGLVAEERPLEFLRALQDNGYPDLAADYLKQLQAQPDKLPAELRDTWDLEMCKTLQSSAKQAYNAKEAEQLTAEAEKYLNKFLQEKGSHPEAATAQVSWGMMLMDRALQHLREAQRLPDKEKAQKTAQFDAARAGLEEARPRFAQAIQAMEARLKKTPRTPLGKGATSGEKAKAAQRSRLETDWVNGLFQAALVEYYEALTYADPKSPERKARFLKASKAFDGIWQMKRVTEDLQVDTIGLFAHMWDGKIRDEMGDRVTALDIYDEVLANVPDTPDQLSQIAGLEPLFAQVEQFRLQIVERKSPREFINEASGWLSRNRRTFRNTDGYQGIQLALAKALLADAEKAAGSERTKTVAAAVAHLKEMQGIRSQSQQEAIIKYRELTAKSTTDVSQVNTFDEAIAIADTAYTAGKYSDAVAAYKRALELAEKLIGSRRDPKRVAAVRENLAGAQLGIAYDLFNQGKLTEALDAAKEMAGDYAKNNRESNVGPRAAALAVQTALSIYAAAPADKKPQALQQLEKLAEVTIQIWPGKPEADDARLYLGQAQQIVGKIDGALKIFEAINPNSDRYPVGLFMAGRLYWARYLAAKKIPNPKLQQEAAADRAKAVERVQQSLERLQKTAEPNKPMSKQLADAQLLMGEIYLDGNEPQQAVKLLEPLVRDVQASKPETLDNTMLRMFVGAVRGYVGTGDIDKAGEVGMVLVDLGPDLLPINGTLIEFARMLDYECKKADGEATKLKSEGKKDEADKAKAKADSVKEMLGKLLKKLSARQQLGVGGMVYIADTCVTLGMDEEADRQYTAIEKRVETDPEFAQQAAKALTRVLAQRIGLLRRKGDFDAAKAEVDALIAKHPNALEPRLERARIYQGWAEKDAAKYDDAIGEWSQIRNLLQATRGKKPPEIYDVTYNLAFCLAKHALVLDQGLSSDREAAAKKKKQAEQLLKFTLVNNPTLGERPDMVEMYNALLKDLKESAPAAAGPAEPAPKPE